MVAVISLHIPDPPPVQNKTFPLNKLGLNTSNDEAGFLGVAAFVDILGTEGFELIMVGWFSIKGLR